jgi:hypothetical protein
MIVGNFCTESPFLDGYVPVRIDESTGSVQAEGEIAFSKITELEAILSKFGVVRFWWP